MSHAYLLSAVSMDTHFINGGALAFIVPAWLTVTHCFGTQMKFS
jgi:hypothetical protein